MAHRTESRAPPNIGVQLTYIALPVYQSVGNNAPAIAEASDVAVAEIQRRGASRLGYMELILTEQCNLRCDYCFEEGKGPRNMSDETAEAAIQFLLEQETPRLQVLFFGGEPLLRFDLIQRTIARINSLLAGTDRAVNYDMTTNGTLLDEKKLDYLRSAGVKFLLSLDGVGKDHDRYRHYANGRGSFDAIWKKLPLMKAYQPWMGVKMTVTPESCPNLPHAVKALYEGGVNQFIIGYGHDIPWRAEDQAAYQDALVRVCEYYLAKKYNKEPLRISMFEEGELGSDQGAEDFGCGAGRGRFCVDSIGDIYGCSKLATITGMRKGVLPIGNVFQGITRPQNRATFLDSGIENRPTCQKCEFNDVCGGGCHAVNFKSTGDVYDPDDLTCRMVFLNRRIHNYMRSRLAEVFGGEGV